MKAVILVAGVSRRLFPFTEHTPKCLLELGGKAIFDHQVNALREIGVREICLVLGYRREQIVEHAAKHHKDIKFTQVINHHFFETNTAHSLAAARHELEGKDFYYLNGDVVFGPELVARLAKSPHIGAFAVEAKRCGDEEVKVVVKDGRIQRISKELPPALCLGEFIGVARIGASMTPAFFDALETLSNEGHRNAYFEAALDAIAPDHPLTVVDVTDLPCIEIDFPADFERAEREVVTRLGGLAAQKS